MRTSIKICGLTRPADAALASRLGADAAGMIFHPPSKRNISAEAARLIVRELGPFVTPVGVFVDAHIPAIVHLAEFAPLGLVQLHGKETPQYAMELAGLGLRFIKAFHADSTLEERLKPWVAAAPSLGNAFAGVLLETAGDWPGGTGKANDWVLIKSLMERNVFAGLPPLIAAGGLTGQNVAGVIEMLHPFAVDVSTGVESTVGIKCPEKLADFFSAVRGARR